MLAFDLVLAALVIWAGIYMAWKNGEPTMAYLLAAFSGIGALTDSVGNGFTRDAWIAWATTGALIAGGWTGARFRSRG